MRLCVPTAVAMVSLRGVDRDAVAPATDCLVAPALRRRSRGDGRAIADVAGMGVPLLVVVDDSDASDELLSEDRAAVDVIVAPFGARELELRLRRLASTAGVADHVEDRGVLIDHHAREVLGAEGGVSLTPREYALLACLARHFGRVVGRPVLIEACARMGSRIDGRGVDVIVTRLRAKLGTAAAHLQTVRGLGYRLV